MNDHVHSLGARTSDRSECAAIDEPASDQR
jgi:hypothetical protein